MKFFDKLRNIIKMTDFFYSSQMLRYEDEMEYRTMTGGIISLGIIVTILVGFASMILDTIELNTITTSMEVIKQSNPTPATITTNPDSMFMFAVEIWGLNLSDSKRYFDLTFRHHQETGGVVYKKTILKLETCRRDHWSQFPQIARDYDKLGMGKWLCPPINASYELQGKYSSDVYKQVQIQVSKCKNATDITRPCASSAEIDQLFLDFKNFFYFDFYFTNPLINSGQKSYKSYYLEDESYAIFGDKLGSETFLYFTDYTIKTDDSIWPFQNIVEDKGCIVENLAINHPHQTDLGVYLTFCLAKSIDSLVYTRSVQKISSVFSFMGGMIGAVSAVLFIIKVYTSFSFQISIALDIFQPGQEDQQNRSSHSSHLKMNFINFVKYYFFKISEILGKPCNYPHMKYVSECQQEILKQLDIKALIKRIIFIEYCLTYLFQDNQLDAIQIKKPRSPQQIKKIRQKCQAGSEEFNQEEQSKDNNNEDNKQEHTEGIINTEDKNMTPQFLFGRQREKNPSILSTLKDGGKVKRQELMVEIISVQRESSIHIPKLPIANIHDLEQKQLKNLSTLHRQVEQGNPLSNRIWNGLDEGTRRKIIQSVDDQ